MRKTSVKLNKPIYCGIKILDLSKVHMYQFLYDYIKPKYSGAADQATLLYMDTDSFIIQIKTKNIFEDMKNDLQIFDTSDYPKSHPCFSTERKKVIGKFKHEQNGVPLSEFCGLRSKMYAYRYNNENKEIKHTPAVLNEEKEITQLLKENGYTDSIIDKHDEDLLDSEEIKEVMKTKGLKLDKQIKFNDYVKAMNNQSIESTYVKQTNIRSKKHKLYTITSAKKGLCWYDDKRHLLDKINQMSFGHYRLRKISESSSESESSQSSESYSESESE